MLKFSHNKNGTKAAEKEINFEIYDKPLSSQKRKYIEDWLEEQQSTSQENIEIPDFSKSPLKINVIVPDITSPILSSKKSKFLKRKSKCKKLKLFDEKDSKLKSANLLSSRPHDAINNANPGPSSLLTRFKREFEELESENKFEIEDSESSECNFINNTSCKSVHKTNAEKSEILSRSIKKIKLSESFLIEDDRSNTGCDKEEKSSTKSCASNLISASQNVNNIDNKSSSSSPILVKKTFKKKFKNTLRKKKSNHIKNECIRSNENEQDASPMIAKEEVKNSFKSIIDFKTPSSLNIENVDSTSSSSYLYVKKNFSSKNNLTQDIQIVDSITDNSIVVPVTLKVSTISRDPFQKKSNTYNNEAGSSKNFISFKEEFGISQHTEIESIEESNSKISNVSKILVEDDSSDDKTVSDLIEETLTQAGLQVSKLTKKRMTLLTESQWISEVSSDSDTENQRNDLNKVCAINLSDGVTVTSSSVQRFPSESGISCALNLQNNTTNTFGSKIDDSSSILVNDTCEDELKTRKRKPKRGSLMELLQKAVQKEKSSVHILRHQVLRKPEDVADKKFAVLKIIQDLSVINGNQFFACKVIEDNFKLFSDLIKINQKIEGLTLTVMIVPEISGFVSVNKKCNIKVFQPWRILDPKQLLIHISRYVLIKDNSTNDSGIENQCLNSFVEDSEFKVVKHFHCPCIENNRIVSYCDTKFKDSSVNVYDIVFS